MLKYSFLLISIFSCAGAMASPPVPATMNFAGITLNINESARRLIQTDVDALTRNQTYFLKKVEKAAIYFPVIERAFSEENVPEDFKYLIIQESAFIADAVSVSNAVGFWQFKEGTAREVGLRVDRHIDERMNITASKHGAAKYLKKNNFFFDNWVYALMAYNTGPGGAEAYVNKKHLGAKVMEITKDTHWYVRKFLAHKIAFEEPLKTLTPPDLALLEYDQVNNKSIKDLADQFDIDYQTIVDYNKWLKHGSVPDDKRYVAVIPVTSADVVALSVFRPESTSKKDNVTSKSHIDNAQPPVNQVNAEDGTGFPIIEKRSMTKEIRINGIPGFIASADDNLLVATNKHRISQTQFLQFNDMKSGDKIIPGQVYYLRSKKTKAKVHQHVAQPGETTWTIAQKYGIKEYSLLTKNRMQTEYELREGMVLWLRFIRPADVAIEYKKTDAQNVVVQSYPNKSEVTSKPPVPASTPTSVEKAPPKSVEISDLSEFLFEEVDENTTYIGDNSFVDLTEASKVTTAKNAQNDQKPYKEQKTSIGTTYHTVKPGETLFAITRMYNVSIGELRQWNNFDNLNTLKPGQQIAIRRPDNSVENVEETYPNNTEATYTVKKEDTLYSIARKYGLTIQELLELNGKTDFIIKEGEILKVKRNQ